MPDSFDAFRYVEFLRGRWRFIAATCGVAIVISLLASLLLPRQYTATASIVIEAPAGNDPRSATAVSPIYLESLKSYEQFASSDSLFLRALERFHVPHDGSSIESLKRRVLRVTKLRDTKILQISGTLPDPKQAHEFAQYLAEETVKLSHDVARDSDQQTIGAAEQQFEAARAGLTEAQAEWERYSTSAPAEGLQTDVDSMVELKASVARQLIEAKANEAEYASRDQSLAAAAHAPDPAGERAFVEKELSATRARTAALDRQLQNLTAEIDHKSAELARRLSCRNQLEPQLKTAQATFDAATSRLRDLRVSAGYRGENLQIIDPGIVPQRPSFPNIPLNLIAALAAGLVISILYLSVAFGYNTMKADSLRASYRSAARVDN